jgi:hypothetical protein
VGDIASYDGYHGNQSIVSFRLDIVINEEVIGVPKIQTWQVWCGALFIVANGYRL